MLAALICSIQDEILNKKRILNKKGTSQIPRTEGWKAAFLAESRSGTVKKVNNKVVSKAQLERLLRKPLALYRKDLPLPPTKHLDLEKHLLGHLFKQAELVYLDSYEIMKS